MLNIIPLEYYSIVFYLLIGALLLILISFHLASGKSNQKIYLGVERIAFWPVVIFFIVYIGMRPISGVFVDMKTYDSIFNSLGQFSEVLERSDPFFYAYMWGMKRLGFESSAFFFLTAFFYIFPIALLSKKVTARHSVLAFLVVISNFSFYTYGVNGIRNGVGTSIFLLVFVFNSRILRLLLLLFSVAAHFSLLMPVIGYAIAKIFKNLNLFLVFWLFSIPLSFVGTEVWSRAIASAGFYDERISYLTSSEYDYAFSSTGFRIDFFAYSLIGVIPILIFKFVFKKSFDEVTLRLFSTYLFANGVWILLITASFSNRFAYLSWFLIGFVVLLFVNKIVSEKKQILVLSTVVIFNMFFSIYLYW